MKYHLNLPTLFASGSFLVENLWNFKLSLSKTLIIRVLVAGLFCSRIPKGRPASNSALKSSVFCSQFIPHEVATLEPMALKWLPKLLCVKACKIFDSDFWTEQPQPLGQPGVFYRDKPLI
jgi:hypothetical protein